jgi:hypothetical protein
MDSAQLASVALESHVEVLAIVWHPHERACSTPLTESEEKREFHQMESFQMQIQ